MVVSDSFTFVAHNGICEVLTHSRLPKDRLNLVLDFIYKAYAPIVVISEAIGNTDYAYTFAQSGNTIDVDKLIRILSKREMGWSLSNEILFSPRPSRLDPNDLMQVIVAARLRGQTAQV